MSDTGNPFGFGKLVPGFDFLQNLVTAAAQGSGAKTPGLSNWIAPTLNVEDLERRISELKAVHFWLEQNGKALAATIQALEVQKMTLATLRGMNFAVGDVAKAFAVKPGEPAGGAAKSADRSSEPSAAKQAAKAYAKSFESVAAPAPAPRPSANEPAANEPNVAATATAPAGADRRDEKEDSAAAAKPAGTGVVDPMQWWGALTSQFQQIAANAMRDAADNPALKASRDIAANALKSANDMTASLTGTARRGAADGRDRAGAAAATQDKPPARKQAVARKTPRTPGARKAASKGE